MNPRIQSLRSATLAAVPRISIERAKIVTDAAKSPEYAQASMPMRRALVFKAIFERKALHIGEGELIVGERGPSPAAVPTYPEICIHTAEDFEMLDSREKIPYRVDDDTRRIASRGNPPVLGGPIPARAHVPRAAARMARLPMKRAFSPSSRSNAVPATPCSGKRSIKKASSI